MSRAYKGVGIFQEQTCTGLNHPVSSGFGFAWVSPHIVLL
jgi:hypothetical protein